MAMEAGSSDEGGNALMEFALVEEARFWLLVDLLDADWCWVLTLVV